MRLQRLDQNRRRRTNRGSAVLVVLVLLAVMGTLAVSNTRVLSGLKQDLRILEKQQLEKFRPPSSPARPAPPAGRPGNP